MKTLQELKRRQEFHIKSLLASRTDSRGRRMNLTSLSLELGEAYGTVAGVVYGNRINPQIRAKIAAFLGQPVEELFLVEDLGTNGNGQAAQAN
ncbi:MAG: hypothetical protein WC600_17075 [Desulfobaccales bacterium]